MYKGSYISDRSACYAANVLISSHDADIKQKLIGRELEAAFAKGSALVFIDFVRGDLLNAFLSGHGYHSLHEYRVGTDNYVPLSRDIRAQAYDLRSQARRRGYDFREYAGMTALLELLHKLEAPDDKSETLKELLAKFKSLERIDEYIDEQIAAGRMDIREARDIRQSYIEYVENGVTADLLLSDIGSALTPSADAGGFSLDCLDPGEAAVIYADANNSIDLNDILIGRLTPDIIQLSEYLPMTIVMNTGVHTQINRLYEIVETLSQCKGIKMIYSSFDIFSGCEEDKAQSFLHFFPINVFGRHSGYSADKISRLFGEQWIGVPSYGKTRDARLLHENIFDIMFHSDHTDTLTIQQQRNRVVPVEDITGLAENECIVFDSEQNRVVRTFV